MEPLELVLLYDYYGALLTDRQRECFELRYCQDMSLGEIGEALGISRQGVHDNLSRTEALLHKMEEKTGCVRRDRACRAAAETIRAAASKLRDHPDPTVSELVRSILEAANALEE